LESAYHELEPLLRQVIGAVSASGQYLLGPETAAFEQEFAEFVGTRYCVAVGSGLDALTIALQGAGIGPQDEVLVPSNTFIATWMAVTRLGATVIPIEPNARSYNIGLASLKAATERTRAVIPVDLYGSPCDMASLAREASKRSLIVIEDAAQAHGAQFGSYRTGSLGHAGCWSFYPAKNLGAFGDAGAITTNDAELADRAQWLRNYGSQEKHHYQYFGYNSRMSEIDAAVLRVKLRVLRDWNERRAYAASQYRELLNDLPILLPATTTGAKPSWHLFVVRTPQRDALRRHLASQGIQTQIHYPIPPHQQRLYSKRFGADAFPIANRLADEVLSLPIGPHISRSQIIYISESMHEFFEEAGLPRGDLPISS
jgi:dTDP-4-amino-4,6-dideoxygalactose transaminase